MSLHVAWSSCFCIEAAVDVGPSSSEGGAIDWESDESQQEIDALKGYSKAIKLFNSFRQITARQGWNAARVLTV